jgi:hypothetical protein
MERTTVRLPTELLERARRKAAAEGRTLTSLIEEGLRDVIAIAKKSKRAAIDLPVSSARGGLQPGFEHDNPARQAQEIEDAEYVEHLRQGFK